VLWCRNAVSAADLALVGAKPPLVVTRDSVPARVVLCRWALKADRRHCIFVCQSVVLTTRSGFKEAVRLSCVLRLTRACCRFGKVLAPLGLEKLQHWIDTGRIDASKVITMKTLVDSGVVGKIKDGVTLVGTVRVVP